MRDTRRCVCKVYAGERQAKTMGESGGREREVTPTRQVGVGSMGYELSTGAAQYWCDQVRL